MPEPTLPLALLLLVGGILALFLELFIPSAGLLFVIAMVCLVSSLAVAFLVSPFLGLGILVLDVVLAFVLPGIGLRLWKMSPMGRRMFLDVPTPTQDPPLPRISTEGLDYHTLMGEVGRTITPLRPAGTTDFDGQRVDTVSEGIMIERGSTVRVVAVEGRRVVVRPVTVSEDELG